MEEWKNGSAVFIPYFPLARSRSVYFYSTKNRLLREIGTAAKIQFHLLAEKWFKYKYHWTAGCCGDILFIPKIIYM